jgi:hypothetical protein
MSPGEKFLALEDRAIRLLRSPFEAGCSLPPAAVPVVVMWRFPAFEPYESWCLASLRDEPRWLLRHSTWHRSMDYARAAHPLKQAAFMIDPAPAASHSIVDAYPPSGERRRLLRAFRPSKHRPKPSFCSGSTASSTAWYFPAARLSVSGGAMAPPNGARSSKQ